MTIHDQTLPGRAPRAPSRLGDVLIPDIKPSDLFIPEPRPEWPLSDRERMEAAVEWLLDAADRLLLELDALDAPGEDLEDAEEDADVQDWSGLPVDCEPSLGSPIARQFEQDGWAAGLTDYREEEHDGSEPGSALEWATTCEITRRDPEGRGLAYRLREGDQTRWASHAHEDDEDGGDEEPSLGAPEQHEDSQIGWAAGVDDDTEEQHDDEQPDYRL